VAEGKACGITTSLYGKCQAGLCGCGGPDQPCCPVPNAGRPTCRDPGYECAYNSPPGGKCVRCGTPDGPCCSGTSCENGGCCVLGRCVADGEFCMAPENTFCKAGSCRCGGVGEVCCGPAATCAASGSSCTVGAGTPRERCEPCGDPGQACCSDNRCRSGCCVRSELGAFRCVNVGGACGPEGMCRADGSCGMTDAGSRCGAPGQRCCTLGNGVTDLFCTTPGTGCKTENVGNTQQHTCAPCGGPGEPCCGTNSGGEIGPRLGCLLPRLRCELVSGLGRLCI